MTAPHPILKVIYDAREAIPAESGGDLGAYLQRAERRAWASGHPMSRRWQYSVRTGMAASRDPQDAVVEQLRSLSGEH